MKHICMFSGGAASSYMSCLVAKEHPGDTILLYTPTYSEHEDADRFRKQVAKYIGLPITVQADGRDIWQLIDYHHALPSSFMPFCTETLKIEQTDKYLKTLTDDFILYYGYGIKEWGRVQKQTARLEVKGIKSAYPICERRIPEEEIRRIIRQEWKICLPETYLYLKHNNCIPCFKGGQKHFYDVWKYYPDRFWMAASKEEQWGYTVFEGISLGELAKSWELLGDQVVLTFKDVDTRPCLCAF